MPYCIYLRKSRADLEAESHGEGETLARHERTLLELARKQKLNVTEIYREIVSGDTIAARPVMQRLLSEVEQGIWTGVIVMEVERLARGDTIDQGIIAQTFKFTNTLIVTPLKTYDPRNEFDEEYFEFGLFMSRREYKTINRRLQRGRIAAVKEGKFAASVPPYGYERVKLRSEPGYTLSPVPDQADVVRLIFDLYVNGEKQPDGSTLRLGVSLIARKLNALGIPSATGGKWSPVSIRDMINNPAYVGRIRWNWRRTKKKMVDGEVVFSKPRNPRQECLEVKGLHPALVDEGTWERAQIIMAEVPPAPVGAKSSVKNPLSGLVVCAKCKHKMVRRPYSGKHASQPPSLICSVSYCDNVSAPLHLVEEAVLDGLAAWAADFVIQWPNDEDDRSEVSGVRSRERMLAKQRAELSSLQKQLDAAHDYLEQGVYTVDTYLERSRTLSLRIAECRDSVSALEEEVEKLRANVGTYERLVPKINSLLEVYHSIDDPAARNKLLKEVLYKVEYLKTVNGRWHNDPADFTIVLYPRIPGSEGFVRGKKDPE